MKKNIIIAAGIIVLIILGLIAYRTFGKSSNVVENAKKIQDKTQEASDTLTGSLQSLFNIGKTQTCTITYPDNSGSGTMYIDGKKVRGDFTVKTDSQTMQSYMISDGEYVYVWSADSKEGMKMKMTEITNETDTKDNKTDRLETQNLDMGKEVSYKCSDWNADNSKFTVPTDIKFTDFSNLIKDVPKDLPKSTGSKIDFSVCDQITDPSAKEACLNALKSGQ